MTLTIDETHNMIAYLTKSDASEGSNQIINSLNGSSIKYALTINPNIYVSCIKQFWTSVAVKKVNNVTRLQPLVDKKKVLITKASIRDALCLDDEKGVKCLPNEEIFTELARMGYEKPSTKLTFYKAFFSSQWKFLIHTILQCMSAKKQVGDLSSHSTKYTSPTLTQKVFANMRRVGKGFSGVDTPLFEGMLVAQEVGKDAKEVHAEDVNAAGVVTEGAASDDDKVAQALEITKLKSRVKKLERRNKASKLKRLKKVGTTQRIDTSDDTVMDDVSKQGGIIANINADDDVFLEVLSMKDEEESKPAKLQEVVDVVTTAKIITEVVTAASTTITAADVPIPAATITAAPTLTAPPRMSYDDIRPIFEKLFNSNVAFLQNTKEQMDEEDRRALKSMNESQEEKAAKKKKLEELKRHLQIVPNDDDDVYTKATLLSLKRLVKERFATTNPKNFFDDFLLITFGAMFEKPDIHAQIWKNQRSVHGQAKVKSWKLLESCGRLVKERFATTNPKNFFDDFLLITFGAMFEKPDIHAQIWKNQRSVHGQAKVKSWKLLESCGVQIIIFRTTHLILLVEKRHPLTRFTLDQMLNNV
nr:hypothetical protein [Tanacetum cinerariifolium]